MSKKLLGFKKIEISFNLTKSTGIETVAHFFFVKKHSSRSEEFPAGKTLFMVNIPVDSTKEKLAKMFADLGEIERVQFQAQKKSGSSCHVVFKDSESVDLILEDCDKFDGTEAFKNENSLASNEIY